VLNCFQFLLSLSTCGSTARRGWWPCCGETPRLSSMPPPPLPPPPQRTTPGAGGEGAGVRTAGRGARGAAGGAAARVRGRGRLRIALRRCNSRAVHSFPHCPLIVYQCSGTHSPPPPPRPGHSFPFPVGTSAMLPLTPHISFLEGDSIKLK
jgi:hypothetical protein